MLAVFCAGMAGCASLPPPHPHPTAVVRQDCIRSTGSLIPPPAGGCLPVSGQSYSHDQIRNTGAPTTGEALRMLDPAVH
jgi:hypothetical protein